MLFRMVNIPRSVIDPSDVQFIFVQASHRLDSSEMILVSFAQFTSVVVSSCSRVGPKVSRVIHSRQCELSSVDRRGGVFNRQGP